MKKSSSPLCDACIFVLFGKVRVGPFIRGIGLFKIDRCFFLKKWHEAPESAFALMILLTIFGATERREV